MELSVRAYLALVVLMAAQRLAELVRSRRHIRALAAQGHGVEREPVYAAMVATHTFVLVAAPLEVIAMHRAAIAPVAIAALIALVLGQLGRWWVFRTLGGAWNVRVVQPTRVITGGPYRWVRHPNYAIVCIEIAALPLVHGAVLTALVGTLANAWVLHRRIAFEESILARDPAWRSAFAAIPRIIPWGRRAG